VGRQLWGEGGVVGGLFALFVFGGRVVGCLSMVKRVEERVLLWCCGHEWGANGEGDRGVWRGEWSKWVG